MKSARPKPYLKIGEVARLAGISPSMIRSWERLGLTRPQRTASKYRVYTPQDVKLLKRARFLRKVRGLNAAAIVQLLVPILTALSATVILKEPLSWRLTGATGLIVGGIALTIWSARRRRA